MLYSIAMLGRGATANAFEAIACLDSELVRLAASSGWLRVELAEGLEALALCGGHHELGFATVEGYALERCERSARWVQESRALARRLVDLPGVRSALYLGEIGFCMAQIVAKVAHAEDEAWWLELAKQQTVRGMRARVKEREAEGQMFAVEEALTATLTVTVDAEDGRLFECARMLGRQQGDGTLEETLDGLLAEGTTSLLAEMGADSRVSMAPFDDAMDEDAPQRAWEKQLAQFREEAEKRCELALGERMRANGVAATVGPTAGFSRG